MLNLEYYGEPLTHEKIVPGNTVTSLSANCYNYVEYDLPFDSGGTAVPVAGDWLIGATGGAQGCIVSVTVTSGAFLVTGNAAGTFRLKSCRGTTPVNNEILNLVGVDVATVDGVPHLVTGGYDNYGKMATVALIVVTGNQALITIEGSNPDQSSLIGIPMPINSSLVIRDPNILRKMKVVDYVSGSASTINVTYYF